MPYNCSVSRFSIGTLTADEACKGLAEEGKDVVHVREGVGLLRVTLQHGPAGGHVQGGRTDWVHSGALGRQPQGITAPESQPFSARL